VIKTGGEWISSLELEDFISRHPAVSEVAVLGVKDEKWGERPMALIVLRPGQSADVEGIKAHVASFVERGLISKYGIPDQIRFVEVLEKTSVGKLNKRAMREKLAR
jgi:fatty-acyl-CoA synthase